MDQAIRQLERQAASGNIEDLLRYIRARNKLGERVRVSEAQIADVLEACCQQQWVPRISFPVPGSVSREMDIYVTHHPDSRAWGPGAPGRGWRVRSGKDTCEHFHRSMPNAAKCAKRRARAQIFRWVELGNMESLKKIIELYRKS